MRPKRRHRILIYWIVLGSFLLAYPWLVGQGNDAPAPIAPTAPERFLKKQWTTEDGLPQSTVTSMVQTRDGYLWLGTFGGLVRFDGIRFTTFNTANSPELRGNRITALHEDRDGVLWIGEEAGGVVRFQNGHFQGFLPSEAAPSDIVSAIYHDRTGGVWIANATSLKRYAEDAPAAKVLASLERRVYSISEDAAGDLWFGVGGGLTRWHNGQFADFIRPNPLLPNFANLLEFDGSRRFWLYTDRGIDLFENGEFRNLFKLDIPRDRRQARLAIDSHNEAWLGYFGHVYHVQADGHTDDYSIAELSSGGVRSMLFDSEGNLWIGTNGDGLIRLRPRQVRTLSKVDGLPGDEISAITEDPVDGVWIAAGPLVHWQNGRVTQYTAKNPTVGDTVSAIAVDHKGVVWFGSFSGLSSVENGVVVAHPDPTISRQLVKSIYADRENNIWVGRRNGGLQRLKDGRFTTFTRAQGLVNDDVRYITQDRAGDLWIGTVGGMSRLRDGAFQNFTTADGLSNDFVREIYEDEDGTYWIGTYGGGINRFRDGKFVPITMKDGLFDDFVSRILPDQNGNLWVLGNRGIFSVARSQLNEFADGRTTSVLCSPYQIADGLLSSEGNGGNQPAGWRMRDGTLWFPMVKGVAIIDPNMTGAKPPPVLIEQVTVDRKPVDLGEVLTIKPSQENLEIRFTGLSFTKPEQVKFRYKLENLDTDWVYADTRRVAYFPHLPPGNYRFVVSAANSDGRWSEQTAMLRIVVLRPFWQRWWFLTAVGLVALGLIALVFQLRVNQLKRRRHLQEEFSRRLIDGHETERRRMAAELHDGLGQDLLIIKNWAALGLTQANGDAPVRAQLEEISTTAARALGETRTMVRNLRPFHLERFGLSKAIEYTAESVEAASGIVFEREIENIDGLFTPESEISIYRVVQECLNNIVKHSGATNALIRIERVGSVVIFTIKDNGNGVRPEPDAKERSGFGLMGMAERVNLLNGKFGIESVTGKGTTVSITLPIPKRTQ